MSYLALYRKWRPVTFSGVIGQHHISDTLSRAVAEGRTAHAYLFSGPRGTGKTSMAKIMAKAVNCEKGPSSEPCNQCRTCREINEGISLDVYEIDAASNRGIEEIRSLKESVQNLPSSCRKKVYIIDEVHMLTKEAFNALLKTLEEPPSHVLFILATTEPEKIPLTILSRCQRYEFHRISVDDMKNHLLDIAGRSQIPLTEEAAGLLAVQADGGLRDALSLLDQCAAAAEGPVDAEMVYHILGLVGREQIMDLADRIFHGQSGSVLHLFYEILQMGREPAMILRELQTHLRNLLLCQVDPSFPELAIYGKRFPHLKEEASLFSDASIDAMLDSLRVSLRETERSESPRMAAEMGLLRLCRLKGLPDWSSLAERVSALEALVSAGEISAVPEPRSVPSVGSVRQPSDSPKPVSPPHSGRKPAPAASSVSAAAPPPPASPVPSAVSPSPADGEVSSVTDPSSYLSVWKKVLDEFMKARRIDILTCFQKSSLILIAGSRAVISAPQQFLVLAANNPSYQKAVSQAFQNVIGRPLIPRTVLRGSPEEQAALSEVQDSGARSRSQPRARESGSSETSDSGEDGYHPVHEQDIPAEDRNNPALSEALKFMSHCDIYEKKIP